MQGPSSGEDDDDQIAAINIIPLVDVVLVLLIIFMVTTVFSRDSAMKLDLPEGSRADHAQQAPTEITVSVDAKEKVTVNGQPTTIKELNARIKSLTSPKRKSILVLRGDRRVLYGTIMPVLDEISRSGVELTLALQAPAASSSGGPAPGAR